MTAVKLIRVWTTFASLWHRLHFPKPPRPQFEDRQTLDVLLDNLFNSFDCDCSGARELQSGAAVRLIGEEDGRVGRQTTAKVAGNMQQ